MCNAVASKMCSHIIVLNCRKPDLIRGFNYIFSNKMLTALIMFHQGCPAGTMCGLGKGTKNVLFFGSFLNEHDKNAWITCYN